MNTDIELPADVIAEIEANRRVSAIKRLRAHEGIGLKEARARVDAYAAEHPPDTSLSPPESDTGFGRIVIMVIGVSLIYALYRFLVG